MRFTRSHHGLRYSGYRFPLVRHLSRAQFITTGCRYLSTKVQRSSQPPKEVGKQKHSTLNVGMECWKRIIIMNVILPILIAKVEFSSPPKRHPSYEREDLLSADKYQPILHHNQGSKDVYHQGQIPYASRFHKEA